MNMYRIITFFESGFYFCYYTIYKLFKIFIKKYSKFCSIHPMFRIFRTLFVPSLFHRTINEKHRETLQNNTEIHQFIGDVLKIQWFFCTVLVSLYQLTTIIQLAFRFPDLEKSIIFKSM